MLMWNLIKLVQIFYFKFFEGLFEETRNKKFISLLFNSIIKMKYKTFFDAVNNFENTSYVNFIIKDFIP